MYRWQQVVLCLSLVAAIQVQDRDLFFSGVPDPTSILFSENDLDLELIREYGDRDQGLVFGTILDLAVGENGTLAVVDHFGCHVWTVDTRTGDYRALGGCGDGPGEFREATAAAFNGDTLLVWDRGRASLVKLTLDGEEIERFRMPHLEMGFVSLSDFHVGNGGSLLAGLNLLPNSMTPEDRQLALFDKVGGTVTRRGLVNPAIASNTPRNVVRPISLCVAAKPEGEDVVFALNHWGPQLVLLRRNDLEPVQSVRIPLDWVRSEEHSLRPGHWGPMSPPPRAICGDRYAIAGYMQVERGEADERIVSSAALVVFDLRDGNLTVLGGNNPPEPGSVLLMTPGDAIGDRFFFYTNNFHDWPVVREYRLVSERNEP